MDTYCIEYKKIVMSRFELLEIIFREKLTNFFNYTWVTYLGIIDINWSLSTITRLCLHKITQCILKQIVKHIMTKNKSKSQILNPIREHLIFCFLYYNFISNALIKLYNQLL